MTGSPSAQPKVAVVQRLFAHYQGAFMQELLGSRQHDYLLVGGRRDPMHSGIRTWDGMDPARFVHAPCWHLGANLTVQWGLIRLALRRDIRTIIYEGSPYLLSTWLSAPLARLTGKRVFFWTHGWTRDERGMKDRIRRAFFRLGHGLLCYGHFGKQMAMQRGFPPERIHVVYNSLDCDAQKALRETLTPERRQQTRRELFEHAERPLLICCSRLQEYRRLDLLLEAMAHLKQDGDEVNLLLVGDGPQRPALEKTAAENGLSVKFFGACYDEEVLAGLLAAADLTVVPGAVGLTAMQSLVYGTPVVTRDDFNGQGPEWEAVIPDRTGGLFRAGDSGDLARAIRAWTRKDRPDRQIREACYELIDRFYNPAFQRRVFDRAAAGEPADDLFWLKERSTSPAVDRCRPEIPATVAQSGVSPQADQQT